MDVQAFSQNDELKKDFIEKSPEWLNRIGGEKERNEYLNRRVKIDILERIEYEKGEEKGFKISVS
jgi:hypothetical protein